MIKGYRLTTGLGACNGIIIRLKVFLFTDVHRVDRAGMMYRVQRVFGAYRFLVARVFIGLFKGCFIGPERLLRLRTHVRLHKQDVRHVREPCVRLLGARGLGFRVRGFRVWGLGFGGWGFRV